MGFLDWLIVPTCPLCHRTAQEAKGCFCRYCAQQLQDLRYKPWYTASPLPVYTWGIHQGGLRRALHLLKYGNQPQIGETLGEWLADSWRRHQGSTPRYTVVPVPLHQEKYKQRGYNQAEILSDAFANATGMKHHPTLLERTRKTNPQYELDAQHRRDNLTGAFRLVQVPRTAVLLIDDVYTTGSTVTAIANVLKEACVDLAGVVVVAKPLLYKAPLTSRTSRSLLRKRPHP